MKQHDDDAVPMQRPRHRPEVKRPQWPFPSGAPETAGSDEHEAETEAQAGETTGADPVATSGAGSTDTISPGSKP